MTGSLKILIVEDNPLLRMMTQKQLATLGYSAEAVGSGEQALEKVDAEIGLILMDIGLPGIDGCQTTRAIRDRENNNARRRIPIIALTAHSERDQCLLAGMDDFMQKPVLLTDLKAMIEKWLAAGSAGGGISL